MFSDLLRRDRERFGLSIGQAAWRLGISIREYRDLEAGVRSPSVETWDRICMLYGWPQTFASYSRSGKSTSHAPDLGEVIPQSAFFSAPFRVEIRSREG
jgi:transcriptional regulator with XRE-family HTH domain